MQSLLWGCDWLKKKVQIDSDILSLRILTDEIPLRTVPVEDLTLLSVVAVKLPLCIPVSCRVRLQREGRGVFILVDEFHPEI